MREVANINCFLISHALNFEQTLYYSPKDTGAREAKALGTTES